MSSLAARCPASTNGVHHVAHAAAEVCYIDDRSVDVDLDVVCELCGASGHCLTSAAMADVDWTFDADETGEGPA